MHLNAHIRQYIKHKCIYTYLVKYKYLYMHTYDNTHRYIYSYLVKYKYVHTYLHT